MQTLNTEQLNSLIQSSREDFTLINVLGEDAFNANHIPGSINIPISQDNFLDAVADVVADTDEHIVVYCADENCPASSKAAEKLETAGYANVFDYEGGMAAWQSADNPAESA